MASFAIKIGPTGIGVVTVEGIKDVPVITAFAAIIPFSAVDIILGGMERNFSIPFTLLNKLFNCLVNLFFLLIISFKPSTLEGQVIGCSWSFC